MPKSPLPPREGISASSLRAPGGRATHAGAHLPVPDSVGQWLHATFPAATDAEVAALLDPADGSMVDEAGVRVEASDAVVPGGFYFFHRPVPAEERVPFEIAVVHEDADLLVVDKPHFLASTPNGRFVRECVVTRLRVERDEPDLVAIHRLDRVTAGLLVLSRRPATRGRFQTLFQERKVRKRYRAVVDLRGVEGSGAPAPGSEGSVGSSETLSRLLTGETVDYASRLVKPRGGRQVLEVPGEPNAFTRLRLAAGETERLTASVSTESAVVDLFPLTGKTHQLRVHLNALGIPILGDPVYPVDLEPDPYDFSRPLQLLAAGIEFPAHASGGGTTSGGEGELPVRRFESGLRLAEEPTAGRR